VAKYFSKLDLRRTNKINDIIIVKDERNLLLFFALLVFKFDPDLLISYDHEAKGIYYLVNRAVIQGINYCEMLSRSLIELDYIYDAVVFTDFEIIKSTFLTKEALVISKIL
jgi:DNA polymerase elongation subunit (family B)